MKIGEITKSGPFALTLLVAVLVGGPFGVERLLETFDEFFNTGVRFPVRQTIKGWFASSAPAVRGGAAVRPPVDWERYRKELEEFTEWAEGRSIVAISLPTNDPSVIELPMEKKSARQIWHVPVTSCTAAGAVDGDRGYVFVSGFDRPFREGARIEPTKERCGYEIVNVGERAAWFRAIYDPEGDSPMGIVRFPVFERVEGRALVRRNRRYVSRDAFPLVSGGWLMIDSFLPPDGVIFKIIDENHCEKATILCLIIDEKGGK